MTLAVTWAAAGDRSAGTFVTFSWVDPEGVPAMTGGGTSTDIPYLPNVPATEAGATQ